MYGTTSLLPDSYRTGTTFSVYRSTDLENFDEGKIIFDGSKIHFWAEGDYWASEMHVYREKYYLFATGIAEGKCRGTYMRRK